MGYVSIVEDQDYKAAIEWYISSLATTSWENQRLSRDGIGACFLKLKEYEVAYTIFSDLLREDPNDSWAVGRIAQCLKDGLGCQASPWAARCLLEDKDIWKTDETCASILLEIYEMKAEADVKLENRIECIIMVAEGFPHLFEEMIKKLTSLFQCHSTASTVASTVASTAVGAEEVDSVWIKVSTRIRESILNPHSDYELKLHQKILQIIN